MRIEQPLIPNENDSYPVEFEQTETNTLKQARGVNAGWECSHWLRKRPKRGVWRTGSSLILSCHYPVSLQIKGVSVLRALSVLQWNCNSLERTKNYALF
jgi:hypothetical protein